MAGSGRARWVVAGRDVWVGRAGVSVLTLAEECLAHVDVPSEAAEEERRVSVRILG